MNGKIRLNTEQMKYRRLTVPVVLVLLVLYTPSIPTSAADATIAPAAVAASQAEPIPPGRLAKLQRCSRLIGLEIQDSNGHKLGKIGELYVQPASGRAVCVMAKPAQIYGGFETPVPVACFTADARRVVLGGDKTALAVAPHSTGALADASDLGKLVRDGYKWFDTKPVWDDPAGPTGLAKASQVIGMKLRNRAGENLGDVVDLMLDLPSARVVFAVASLDGTDHTLYAVPATALTADPQDSTLLLNASRDKVAENARGGDFLWDQIANPAVATGIYQLYGQQGDFAPARKVVVTPSR